MTFLSEWAGSKSSGGGNYFKDGRGKLIVKNLTVETTRSDPKTFIADFYIKESAPTGEVDSSGKLYPCNPAGGSVSFTKLLTKRDGEKGRAMACVKAILGPESEGLSDEALAAEMAEVMNIDEKTNLSRPGAISIARGLEVSYETYRKWTKDNKTELTIPKFTHVALTPEQIKANRALLGAAAVPEVAEEVA